MKFYRSPESFLKRGPKHGPRILVGDIETFPMLVYAWRMFKANIGKEQVVQDVTMMSFGVKWKGQDDFFYDDMSKAKTLEERRNDRHLAHAIRSILDGADFMVAHNGRKFDLRQIRSRCAQNAVPPWSQVQVIDTYELNKRAFDFSSQALGFVSPKFMPLEAAKSDHAQFPGFSLWRECLAGNKEAWRECKAYNCTDLTSLEAMYDQVLGWYEGHPNLGPYIDWSDGRPVCPRCGSDGVEHLTTPYRTQVGVHDQYRCGGCGGHSRGRVLIASRKERAHILMG